MKREKNKTEINNIVKKIISEITGNKTVPDDKLLDAGVLDSLSTMQLIQMLEKKFKIKFSADEFSHANFNSIQSIAKLIDSKIKK